MLRQQTEFDDVRMRGFSQPAAVADVLRLIDARLSALPAEAIRLGDASERVLAESVVSTVAVPGFDRAAMDGYAVAAVDTPETFTVVGESLPGRPYVERVQKTEAIRIMTGAPVPAGTDCVVPVEQTILDGECVSISSAFALGRNVGRRGEDIEAGNAVLASGRVLRPQDLGLLASIGAGQVSVVRQPRVSILVTGDELLACGSRPNGYRIVDSNSVMLSALLLRDGGIVDDVRLISDSIEAIRAAIVACRSDLVLITGGSSVGCEDFAPGIVAGLGELPVHGVNLRPAAPLGLGFINDLPIFLIPGNPVSCLCAYDIVVGHAVRRLAGRSPDMPYRTIRLPLAEDVKSAAGRLDYVRIVVCNGEASPLRTLWGSGASMLSSVTRADGFLLVPDKAAALTKGQSVEVFLYDG